MIFSDTYIIIHIHILLHVVYFAHHTCIHLPTTFQVAQKTMFAVMVGLLADFDYDVTLCCSSAAAESLYSASISTEPAQGPFRIEQRVQFLLATHHLQEY